MWELYFYDKLKSLVVGLIGVVLRLSVKYDPSLHILGCYSRNIWNS